MQETDRTLQHYELDARASNADDQADADSKEAEP